MIQTRSEKGHRLFIITGGVTIECSLVVSSALKRRREEKLLGEHRARKRLNYSGSCLLCLLRTLWPLQGIRGHGGEDAKRGMGKKAGRTTCRNGASAKVALLREGDLLKCLLEEGV